MSDERQHSEQPGEPDWGYLSTRTTLASRAAVLEIAVRLAFHLKGSIIEFGVANGGSTRVIRRVASQCERLYPAEAKKRIYACDSFEGLREKFENADVGTFKTKPPRIAGVEIVKGYFEDSLTAALAAKVGPVAFASLDADLFSSTLCALRWLTPLLRTGSLLLFDEFLGENESEKRAFEQWSAETGIRTILIADFLREPSGWSGKLERRPLFQVLGREELEPQTRIPSLRQRVDRTLTNYPALRRAAKRAYRLVK
jgi:hypothetical protein